MVFVHTSVCIYLYAGVVIEMRYTNINISEVGNTNMTVCVTLIDVKNGLDRSVIFELHPLGGSAIGK